MTFKKAPELTVDKIISAPEHQLRAVLKALCTSDGELHERVSKYLVSIMNKDETVTSTARSGGGGGGGTKRKAEEDEKDEVVAMKRAKMLKETHVCVQCGGVYLESENIEKLCFHHPGRFFFPFLFLSFFFFWK